MSSRTWTSVFQTILLRLPYVKRSLCGPQSGVYRSLGRYMTTRKLPQKDLWSCLAFAICLFPALIKLFRTSLPGELGLAPHAPSLGWHALLLLLSITNTTTIIITTIMNNNNTFITNTTIIITNRRTCLQEVLHALHDRNRKVLKRPCLTPPHGQHPPAELVALMQRCWHQVPAAL